MELEKPALNTPEQKQGTAAAPADRLLPEAHRAVEVVKAVGFGRKLPAFSSPGYLVVVGFMDPGNWLAANCCSYMWRMVGRRGVSTS